MSTLPNSKDSTHATTDITPAPAESTRVTAANRNEPYANAPVAKLVRLPSSPGSMGQDASQRFGNYVLEERLAIGGMAEVFRARRVGAAGFSRTVVIKRILPNFCQDRAFVEMFIDEANTGAQLRHSNIVAIDDFGEVDGRYFLAMEFIQGVDAARLLQALTADRRSLPWEVAAFIVREVLSALDYAHRKKAPDGGPLNVVHRDVSPHNVLVSTAGEIKLTDFGIARARTRIHQTSAHVVKGKLAYMAPEQARAHTLDGRADLFAVGVSAFELLANQRPFVGKNEPEVVTNLLKGRRERISTLRPDVPPQLEAVIDGLLETDRDRRFESAATALAALDPLVTPSAGRTLAAIIAHYFFPAATSVSAVRAPIGALPGALPSFPMRVSSAAPVSTPVSTPPAPRLSRPSAGEPAASPVETQVRAPVPSSPPSPAHEISGPAIEHGAVAELSSVTPAPEERTAVSAVLPLSAEVAPAVTRDSTDILPPATALGDLSAATVSASEATVRPQDAVTRTSMRPAVDAPATIAIESATPSPAKHESEERSGSVDSVSTKQVAPRRPSLAIVAAIVTAVLLATLVVAWLRGTSRRTNAAVSAAPRVESVRRSSAPAAPSPPARHEAATPVTAEVAPEAPPVQRAQPGATAHPPAATPAPIARSTRRTERRAPRSSSVAVAQPLRSPVSSRGTGTLAIQASPWAELEIDGNREGLTPVYRRISAGTHRITLVHPPSGHRAVRTVNVRANEVTRLVVELR